MKHTERTMLDLIHHRHPSEPIRTGGEVLPPRYLFIEHPSTVGVNSNGDGAVRTLDALVLDRYKTRGHREIHGFEVKVTRGDLLRELRDMTKSGAWERYCHRFWVVVPDPTMIRPGELPPHWGALAPTPSAHGQLEVIHRAKLRKHPDIMTNLGDLIWQAVKTDRRHRPTGGTP